MIAASRPGGPSRPRSPGARSPAGSRAATAIAGRSRVAASLVREGLAVGYRDYESEEAAARARRAGLWAGEFQNPGAWRQEHPRS